ncbi:RNA polymerase sigma factor [Pedobacter foliorum]|uniref:RNA polymerase sigma factor n=1 Tax=Pedobacter foliorum TaxID=2739058 RepID=UPI0015644F84|nr:sigma-70 family RNA polymerase sigma factor [Pedobacter foliorum]NRF40534.1 sigma-70 family RNA polymerase sigma factor [Pedobacter foliorum]
MKSGLLNIDDDKMLLQLMRDDCRTAFDTLYQKYWKLVLNTGYKRLKDLSKAEDVAQDVFTQLWLRRKDVVVKNVSAYLFTAVRNCTFTLLAKENRYIPINDLLLELKADRASADAQILLKEFMKAYEAMVDALPNQQKTIFKMRYHQELTTDEIAVQLQLSPKTVRNHLGRAITTLRASLMMAYILVFF